jgi:hypothetical protein
MLKFDNWNFSNVSMTSLSHQIPCSNFRSRRDSSILIADSESTWKTGPRKVVKDFLTRNSTNLVFHLKNRVHPWLFPGGSTLMNFSSLGYARTQPIVVLMISCRSYILIISEISLAKVLLYIKTNLLGSNLCERRSPATFPKSVFADFCLISC